MQGVDADTPATPAALAEPPPASGARENGVGVPSRSSVSSASRTHTYEEKRGRMISDKTLMDKHPGNPERGELVVKVRCAIWDKSPGNDCFSVFAGQISKKMKCTGGSKTGKSRDRKLIRKGLSDQFGSNAGPSVETIRATLLLAVAGVDRETTAMDWNWLYAQAHKNLTDDELPDFLDVISNPETYLNERGMSDLDVPIKAPEVHIPRSRDSVDDMPTASADAADSSDTAATAFGDPAAAPRSDEHSDGRTDEHTDEHPEEDREARLREREELAKLRHITTKYDPFLVTAKRYEALSPPEDEPLTDERIQATIAELDRRFRDPVEVIEPAEDLARTTQQWQESAADQPVTVGLPSAARTGMIFTLIVMLLVVLACVGYKVIVTL